ncbi:1-phosphofructokinase [Pectinatus haikarae]|uniref:Tagatose-6-phosphate kinase n=1 Tax=Pectinatus haikarae TaxID=349096 RepID=A0ABT9Y452_9FIRM|nr:1-phosphofructokinase [Pectinatus haikarae]MDQ0202423.1 1-phosphofructokinase [Pectinatus haikarae]
MIYTVTFNPSLDYIVRLDSFKTGTINRLKYEKILCGGKGINVSIVLKNLGVSSIASGFTAGFTGEEIERQMKNEFNCSCDFIHLSAGNTRINVKIKADSETEVNGQGPNIPQQSIDALFAKLDKLQNGDYLVLAGSIPNTLPNNIYERILERLYHKNVNFVVDAEGKLLLNVLEYKPFLIKPNNHELGGMFGKTLTTPEALIEHARILQQRGARNILISRGGDGAILLTEKGDCMSCAAPTGTLINSVGAGDSMVAGFLAGYLSSADYKTAFRMGIAAGSASAFSENLAVMEEVDTLMKQITI